MPCGMPGLSQGMLRPGSASNPAWPTRTTSSRSRSSLLSEAAGTCLLRPFGPGIGPGQPVQALAFIVLCQAQVAPGGIVHCDQETVGAAQEVQPSEIGLQESRRELEIDPPCGDRDAPHLQVDRLLVGIAVELGQ